jgi:hypothetical protein
MALVIAFTRWPLMYIQVATDVHSLGNFVMNHLCFQKAFEAIMLAEVFIFIQHVIGFYISIGNGLFSSSIYRAMAFFIF